MIGKVWIKNGFRPIMSAEVIKRGKNKGRVRAILTNGRDAKGNVKPGRKVIIAHKSVKVWPEREG